MMTPIFFETGDGKNINLCLVTSIVVAAKKSALWVHMSGHDSDDEDGFHLVEGQDAVRLRAILAGLRGEDRQLAGGNVRGLLSAPRDPATEVV